jgi:hypothetical protein
LPKFSVKGPVPGLAGERVSTSIIHPDVYIPTRPPRFVNQPFPAFRRAYVCEDKTNSWGERTGSVYDGFASFDVASVQDEFSAGPSELDCDGTSNSVRRASDHGFEAGQLAT